MKRLFLLLFLLLPLLAKAQPAPVVSASQAQVNAGTQGAPFYVTPATLHSWNGTVTVSGTNAIGSITGANVIQTLSAQNGNGTSNAVLTLVGLSASNILYVDPLFGLDANSGIVPWLPLKTISNAVAISHALTNPVISCVAGIYTLDASGNNQYVMTNTTIIGAGPNATYFIVTTNGTGSASAVFDLWGSFTMRGVWMSNAYQNAASASYPMLEHTFVGNATNVINIDNCIVYGQSDDLSATGTTTSGKTFTGLLIENSFFYNSFDGFSIGIGTNGANIINSVFRSDTNYYGVSGFGNGFTAHAFSDADTLPGIVNVENSHFIANGFTNNWAFSIAANLKTFNFKNCTFESIPMTFTTNYFRITNSSTATVNLYGVWNDNLIGGSGTFNWYQGSTTNTPFANAVVQVSGPSGTNAYWTQTPNIGTNVAPVNVLSNFTPNFLQVYSNLTGADIMVEGDFTEIAAGAAGAGQAIFSITNNGTGHTKQIGVLSGGANLTNQVQQLVTFRLGVFDSFEITTNVSGAALNSQVTASPMVFLNDD